jgi:hypothetical protein
VAETERRKGTFWEGGNEMKLGGNLVKGHDQPSSPNRRRPVSTEHAFQGAVILSMHNTHIREILISTYTYTGEYSVHGVYVCITI